MSPIGHRSYPQGPTGATGPAGYGFDAVYNPVPTAVLTSNGTVDSAIAQNNLRFDGSTLNVTGSILTSGTVIPSTYRTGQTINTLILNHTAINQGTNGNTLVLNGGWQGVASYTYSPLSNYSTIIVEYFTKYTLGGNSASSTDSMSSRLIANGNAFALGYQQWIVGSGTGTRSGTAFPLMGGFDNTSFVPVTIYVQGYKGGDDDIVLYNDNGAWMRITEISQ